MSKKNKLKQKKVQKIGETKIDTAEIKQNKNENKTIKIKPKQTHQLLYPKMRACVPSKMVYGGTTKLTKKQKNDFLWNSRSRSINDERIIKIYIIINHVC